MHILSLPTELRHIIIIHCILIRGIKRGVRLRLVCKQFKQDFLPALYQSRLLDNVPAPRVGYHWHIRDDRYGAAKLWQGYLAQRVLNETSKDVGRFVEIREAAEAMHSLTAAIGNKFLSVQEIVHGLCWLALERGTNRPGKRQWWIRPRPNDVWNSFPTTPSWSSEDQPSSLKMNLLYAAAYFNEVTVAADLLQASENDCSPTDQHNLFPSPIEIAAFRDNVAILDLFQRHILHKNPHEFTDDESFVSWACEETYGAIQGAVINGGLNLLVRILFPPSVRPHPPAVSSHIRITSDRIKTRLQYIQSFSSTPIVYDYLGKNFRGPYKTTNLLKYWLTQDQKWYALHGNLLMLRHVMSKSPEYGYFKGKRDDPLNQACRLCFEDMVDFLLQQKIEPKKTVLNVAARGGSVKIIKSLLIHGIKYPRWSSSMGDILIEIILGENTAMLELVFQHGYIPTPMGWQRAMKRASSEGLESMVEILKKMDIGTELSSKGDLTRSNDV